MSVPSNLNKHVYNGNGVTTNWSFTFPVILAADIQVVLTDTDGIDGAALASNLYTVDTTNSVVIYPTVASGSPALPSGWKITIVRVEPLTQLTTLTSQGAFSAANIEDALDKLTMIAQQHDEILSRVPQYPVSQTPSSTDTEDFINTVAGYATDAAASETAAAASAVTAAAQAAIATAAAASLTSFWCGTAGGTADVFTLTPSPAISAYAAGQQFRFIAVGTNTVAPTVNVSAKGAKSVKTQSGAALSAGELVSGKVYSITYDGTNFITHELATPEDGKVTYAKLSITGAILNADLAGSIADSKLSTISTAGKVSGAALTSLASIPGGAGAIPAANLSAACLLTTDQTVAGIKTFSSGIVASSGITMTGTLSGGSLGQTGVTLKSLGNGETWTVTAGRYICGGARDSDGSFGGLYHAAL